MNPFANQKFNKTLSLWVMVALLSFVQFAKASHSIEHDITAEQFHCQICSLVATDDLIEPDTLSPIFRNEFHLTIELTSLPFIHNETDRSNAARAPPISF